MEPARLVVGCDEAGCGCPFGSLYAAAVSLPAEHRPAELCLADSKALSRKRRDRAYEALCTAPGVIIGVGAVQAEEIDREGLGWARRVVFHRALDQYATRAGRLPDEIIVDGTLFADWRGVAYRCVPRADSSVPCVSAASIVAKVSRDAWVDHLLLEHPQWDAMYGLSANKGYPTTRHKEGIRAHGLTPFHRSSFRLNL